MFILKKIFFRGFTLVELLIVLAIIGVLAGVIFVNYESAREQARDERRKSDIAQIEVALRLYVEQTGADVDCLAAIKIDGSTTPEEVTPYGDICNEGPAILAFLAEHLKTIPHDPLGPGNDDYYYIFDAYHICNSPDLEAVVVAVNFESLASNMTLTCGTTLDQEGGVIDTVSYGGSIAASRPYVKILNFMYYP